MTNPTQPAAAEIDLAVARAQFLRTSDKWKDYWNSHAVIPRDKVLELMAEFALSREREAVRKCARAMCLQCRQEIPVTRYGNHETNEFYQTCAASPIRVLYPEHFKED